jgi:hypothetical protein
MMIFVYSALDGHKGHPYIFNLFFEGLHFSMFMDYGQKRRERFNSIDINALRAKEETKLKPCLIRKKTVPKLKTTNL